MSGFRRLTWGIWLACWPFLAWAFWTSISFRALKIGIILAVVALVFLPLLLFTRAKWARGVAVTALFLAVAIGFWPAQNANSGELSSQNWRSLLAYRGTPYVWGGENARGLDCSGLVRRAWFEANFLTGFRTNNPSLWREAFSIWWNDCSAREMKAGYGGKIVPLFAAKSLNSIAGMRLQNGDLAVTQNGVHVLAYAGKGAWIQADPNLANGGDKVIVVSAPSKNGWFEMPIQILRWRALNGSDQVRTLTLPNAISARGFEPPTS